MREAIGSLIASAKGAEPYPHDDRGWDWRVMRNAAEQRRLQLRLSPD